MPQRIFIVDDEKPIADTLSVILRIKGYDAHAFYDAETALNACEELEPDFVISDVAMPGMSGVELAVQLRNRYPECGILLFSGQASTMDVLEAAKREGYSFDFLEKPVHPTDLLAKLKTRDRQPDSV